MRIKSEIWVMAYIRRCSFNGAPAVIARRGQGDGGAIYIKINTLDSQASIYGPAPAGLDASSTERRWSLCSGEGAVSDAEADSYLQRQADFDPDIWVIEVEDRNGRHFLGESLSNG
ncbi:MAG: DUF1491 family protein [Alphaproteobacteria bacterium]